MLSQKEKNKIKKLSLIARDKLIGEHIKKFSKIDKDLVQISDTYRGVWLEHVYDSILLAELFPEHVSVAVNTINAFIDGQRKDGQYPFLIRNAEEGVTEFRYSQLQECVSFLSLALKVYEMAGDRNFLEKIYLSGKKWISWLKNNRMTLNFGLVEMFYGYDTGHDNSARFDGLKYKENYSINGVVQDASVFPDGETVAPIFAVDVNANYYANLIALSVIAEKLGLEDDAKAWKKCAKDVKKKIFEVCFDKEDLFFYDTDKGFNKRKYLSSTIFTLFHEGVIDALEDKELFEKIYARHVKNPKEFWTEYPFPSMSISDPSWKKHTESNCWGYFSQGLIVLRSTLWMDKFGKEKDFDVLCEKWLKAWTNCYDEIAFGQELDPVTGEPSSCSSWYSSTMLFYLYSAKRLKIIK